MAKKTTAKPASEAGKSRRKSKPNKGVFKKNDPATGERDERINRSGQNRKYTELHRMIDRLFNEKYPIKRDGDIIGEMTALETMMRQWLLSGEYQKQVKALEYWAGKVPDELLLNSESDAIIKENIDLLTDGQLDRLIKGESSRVILIEMLSEVKALKQAKDE
jgi:hypothetical protein